MATVLLMTGCGGTNGCSPTEAELRVDDYISGLDHPWDIAWPPNETVLVTERPGRLDVYVDGVNAAPTVFEITDVVSG